MKELKVIMIAGFQLSENSKADVFLEIFYYTFERLLLNIKLPVKQLWNDLATSPV